MRGFLIALFVFFNTSAHSQEYCLALRGNGELAPAHWGAMANLVEKMGFPVAQAGGSSASITMMLNEAIAANKYIQQSSDEIQRQRASLLYKSLEGFLEYLSSTPEWRDFLILFQRVQVAGTDDWLKTLIRILSEAEVLQPGARETFLVQNIELIKSNYRTGVRLGLISEKNYAPLLESLGRLTRGELANSASDVARARFYAGELQETIRVFGAFNADTDDNLFFRPGLVDFARFAEQLGRVATFYSAISSLSGEDLLWQDFFNSCTHKSSGLTWSELVSNHFECGRGFTRILDAHFSVAQRPNFADRFTGLSIKSFPTTAVVDGQGRQEVMEALKKYAEARDPKFGRGFYLSDSDDVKFAYWGPEQDLRRIDVSLPKASDEKSRRFLGLGQASWRTVLSLSPAEPGLASFQVFTIGKSQMVSAGGWSDLHPVTVLKAAGCERVVYVTRRGGESPFAQGVAKRLLADKNDPSAADVLLRKLYDLENPQSSMRQSLDQADAVLCTDWNRFDVKNGVKEMIKDSYRASPYYVRNQAAFTGIALVPQLNPRDVQPSGRLTYEGCF